jgi:hypothetical protein
MNKNKPSEEFDDNLDLSLLDDFIIINDDNQITKL